MTTPDGNHLKAPLYIVLIVIAGFWTAANLGYYYLFPFLSYSLDYNISPVPIAVYFLLWAAVSIVYFRSLFSTWLAVDYHIWIYAISSLITAAFIVGLLHILAHFPTLHGPVLAPFTDILYATPWYFLPKAAEILVQQILIATLILELYYRFNSLKKVVLGYALCFTSAHVALFVMSSAPTQFATIMTSGAVLSSLLFPYLILNIRGGFVYAYVIHLLFYIALAMVLQTWPPPGFNS